MPRIKKEEVEEKLKVAAVEEGEVLGDETEVKKKKVVQVEPTAEVKKGKEPSEFAKWLKSLSREDKALLAQSVGIVYNAPKEKITTSTATFKTIDEKVVIKIGKAGQRDVKNPEDGTTTRQYFYPMTTHDGAEHKLSWEEYNVLPKVVLGFTRQSAGVVKLLGEPIYNSNKKEYVPNQTPMSNEIFMVEIDGVIFEINSEISPMNA